MVLVTLAWNSSHAASDLNRVRVEILEPSTFGGKWPFAKTAVSVACNKSTATEVISLAWEAPLPDGTGDITTVELLAEPPYIGKTLEEGRSTFAEIVKTDIESQELFRLLQAVRVRAEALCRSIGKPAR